MPRSSAVLNRAAPVDIDKAVAALARRDSIRIMPDGMAAANQLGLTNAIPAKASYLTDGATRDVKIGNRTIHLEHAGPAVMTWAGRPVGPVAQALRWLGPDAVKDDRVVAILRRALPDGIKKDLARNSASLPAWLGRPPRASLEDARTATTT